MIKLARTVISHPLISGSSVIIAGSLLSNVFNFFFNLFMSRNLPIADYGTLVSLISLITLATVPLTSVTPTIVNFAGVYFAKNETDMIILFYRKFVSYLLILCLILLISTFIFEGNIAHFFNIYPSNLVTLGGISVAIIYLGTINTGLLQAKLLFKFISFSNLFSAVIKLLLGISLIMLGFGINGAVYAFIPSFILPFLLSFIPLSFLLGKVKNHQYEVPIKELFSYGIPSAIAILGLNSLISSDLLLVKHLFSPDQAGLYAGMTLVGKVIFFLTAPIGTVMYPLIIRKHAKNENYKNTLLLSVLLVFLPSLSISIFYFLQPEFTLSFFLKKAEFLQASRYLGFFGLFIAIYSLISLLTYYFLSIKKTIVWMPLLLASVIQIIFIYFFHDTFLEVILISLTVSILLLFTLLIYFRKT